MIKFLEECINKYIFVPIYLKLRTSPAAVHTTRSFRLNKDALFIYAHLK